MSLNAPALHSGSKDSLKHDAFSFLTKTDRILTSSISFWHVKITLVLSVCFQMSVWHTFWFQVPKAKCVLKEMRNHVHHSAQVQSLARAAPQKDKRAERRDLLDFQFHDLQWQNE